MTADLHEVLNETIRVMETLAADLRANEWNMSAAVLENQARQVRAALSKALP